MIYIVDDDSEDLEVIQEAFAQYSYKGVVNAMLNAESLLSELNNREKHVKPNVIVLDLNMPFMNGFEALRMIKSDPFLQDIQVIILAASSNKADEIRCLELGCNYFFTKPSRLDDYKGFVTMIKRFDHTD